MTQWNISDLLLHGFCLLCICGATGLKVSTAAAQTRTVRVVNVNAPIGGTANVAIELTAQGNENAVGFSLTFNPAVLGNPQAVLGSGATGASLNAKANQAAQGRLGIALALPTGQTFAAGTRQLAVVTFSVASDVVAGTAPIGFGDQPIVREVSGANADPLTTTFTSGSVAIVNVVTSVSAASFTGATLAAESIVAAFGTKLATRAVFSRVYGVDVGRIAYPPYINGVERIKNPLHTRTLI